MVGTPRYHGVHQWVYAARRKRVKGNQGMVTISRDLLSATFQAPSLHERQLASIANQREKV
ncbi:MAG: hypothetical protein CMM01_23835 [Rhodopirellula sp.]|nr:hypothetical protein [Rhodopirellula sp.]